MWADAGRWDHTADLQATLANCQRGKGQKAFRRADFHPYATGEESNKRTRGDGMPASMYLAAGRAAYEKQKLDKLLEDA